MDYEDFRVLVAGGPDGPEVRVVDSPEGEGAREPFDCSVSEGDLERLERIVQWRSRAASGSRRRRPRPEDAFDGDSLLTELGERLYRCLFSGEVRDRLVQSLARAPDNLRIRLQLDLGTEVPASGEGKAEGREDRVGLHRLPWELLREPGEGRVAFSLRRGTPVVRYLDVEGRPALPEAPETLGVLAVAPEPDGMPRLDLDRELEALREALAGSRDVAFRVLEPPTLEALIAALRGGDVHALHFMGHGELDPRTGDGALVLEDGAGRAQSLPARFLVEQLADFLPRLRLVFLNACRTAEAATGAPWAGVATALVRAGVPAVVAMQLPVTDRAAVTFAGWVYRRLAAGDPVDRAVAEGRLALRREIEGTSEWATPALFLRISDGRVFAPAVRRRPGKAETGSAGGPPAPRRRPRSAAAWIAAGLAVLLLGVLAVLRGGVPVDGSGPVAGAGAGESAVEGSPGSPPETFPGADPGAEAAGAGGRAGGERERAAEPDTGGRSRLERGEPEGSTEAAGSGEPIHSGSAVPDEPAAPTGSDGAGPVGEPGAGETRGSSAPALVELALGESVHVRELGALVTVDAVTVQGTELVRVTVSPDGGRSLVRAGFPGSTLRFPAGGEVLSVHVLSLDHGTGLVRLRARRSGS